MFDTEKRCTVLYWQRIFQFFRFTLFGWAVTSTYSSEKFDLFLCITFTFIVHILNYSSRECVICVDTNGDPCE